MLNEADNNSFYDEFSEFLNTMNHLNLESFIFADILQVLRFEFLKFRILEIFIFPPCTCNMVILTFLLYS